eukprot:658566-Hanusia_phi.AAC.3
MPPVKLTEEEFDAITDSRKLLNSQGELGPEEFETMILTQMSNYVHRKVRKRRRKMRPGGQDRVK